MKRITSILAVLALSSSAYAADTVDMKWNAEMRTRYTSDNAWSGQKGDGGAVVGGYSSNTYNSFGQRNKLGLHLTKGESFQGHVGLINHFFWGSGGKTASGYNGGAANGAGAFGEPNNSTLLLVNEAYGWWKANDMTSLKFGRSNFEIAGGFVLSSDDWLSVPFTYDGIWTMWDFEPVTLNVFGLKVTDTNTNHATAAGSQNPGQGDPENVMYGAIVGFKTLPEMVKKAEVHLLQNNDETNNFAPTLVGAGDSYRSEIMRYGLFLSGDHMGFDYRAAADMYQGKAKVFSNNSSTDFDASGNMFDLGVGYTFPEMMMFRIGAVYHMDSGAEAANTTNKADKTYQPGQYDAHNLGGTWMDAVTWGNLTYYSIDFGVKPMDDLTANLRWTKFTRSSDKNTVAVYGNAAGATTGSNVSNDIGTEIDLSLTKSYGDNFSIWALYGVFTPGDLVKKDGVNGTTGATEEENHTRIQIQGKLTF